MQMVERISGYSGIIHTSYRDFEVGRLQHPTPAVSQRHRNEFFRDEVPLIQNLDSKTTVSSVEVRGTDIILGLSHTNDDITRILIRQGVLVTYSHDGRFSHFFLATGILVNTRI